MFKTLNETDVILTVYWKHILSVHLPVLHENNLFLEKETKLLLKTLIFKKATLFQNIILNFYYKSYKSSFSNESLTHFRC